MGKREVFFDGKPLMKKGVAENIHIKEMALDDPTVIALYDPTVMKAGSYRKKGNER